LIRASKDESGRASVRADEGVVVPRALPALWQERLGLFREADLVLHLPMRYEDETQLLPIAALRLGESVQVEGVVAHCDIIYRPRRQLVVRIDDQSGALVLRFVHFYGSQIKHFDIGTRIRARGEVRGSLMAPEMIHPRYYKVGAGTPLPKTLTPVYPAAQGISQATLRRAIDVALERTDLADTLPEPLRRRLQLAPFAESIFTLHRPPADGDAATLLARNHPAWRRVKFDELLAQQLSTKRARRARRERSAPAMRSGGRLVRTFTAQLPFTLTAAQQRVWREIHADMAQPHPMQRLLQGDVGSGKTVVAALAALNALDHGYQAVLMAPTEILAEQHFRKLSKWVEDLGVRVAWLTGGQRKAQRERAGASIESGAAQLAIGTHALIQDTVNFQRLGLAIVDEQHRFGVGQRLALRAKTRNGQPHQLMMSATPIPRTLAMTYYADLDVSTLDEMPAGRVPVTTKLFDASRREAVIARVREVVSSGQQAYWVCPLIEESDAMQLKTAVETHETLTKALPELSVGLLHGRLSAADKGRVMERFVHGETNLLVATTVIEVGVDIPNATLMVIEHAERFGLAQLHQLRGRIGRGGAGSVCILLYEKDLSADAKERLRIMRETHDGFEIARRDLFLRGPGEFLGQRQSGQALLRFADLNTDQDLVDLAREAADAMLRDAPDLVGRHLKRWLAGREEFLKA